MTTWQLIAVVAIIGVATTVQAVSGFGFSLASMPLLAAMLGVETALAIQVPLGIASNGGTAVRAHGDILRGTAARMLLAMVGGMPLGWLLLNHVSANGLKLLVGIIAGALTVALAMNVRIKATGSGVDWVSGFLSGVLSTSIGTNGPPLVIGLSGRELPAAQQRATLSTCFAIGNIIVFVALLQSGRIDRDVVIAVTVSLPILFAASFGGHQIFGRLGEHHYRGIVIGLLFASSLVAIASALAG